MIELNDTFGQSLRGHFWTNLCEDTPKRDSERTKFVGNRIFQKEPLKLFLILFNTRSRIIKMTSAHYKKIDSVKNQALSK